MNKPRAKPTTAQLVARMYRRLLKIEGDVILWNVQFSTTQREQTRATERLESGQRMLSERMESFRVLADHCARLLREKETLHAENKTLRALADAAQFMSAKPHHRFSDAAKFNEAQRRRSRENLCHFVEQHSQIAPGFSCFHCGFIGPFPPTLTDIIVQENKRCAVENLHREGVLCSVCNQIGL